MKELLESYIVEKLQLQEQVELLSRIITYLDGDTFGVTVEELQEQPPLVVRVEDGMVYVG